MTSIHKLNSPNKVSIMIQNIFNELDILVQKIPLSQFPLVLITLVHQVGSTPQKSGARLLMNKNGEIVFGTVGGGKLEAAALVHANEFILSSDREFDFCTYNLQKDLMMSCGGTASLFFEKINSTPMWSVAVFGAGHIGQELIPLLLKLHCHVTWIDPRTEWIHKVNHSSPSLTIKCTNEMATVLEELPKETDIVIITQGHATDLPILKRALELQFPFVGVIGSSTKAKSLKRDLNSLGLSESDINRMTCPIGEDWATESPFEIALGIVSQLKKRKKSIQEKS